MSRVRIRKRPDEPTDMKQAYLVLHARYQAMKKELANAREHYKTVLDFLEEKGFIKYNNDKQGEKKVEFVTNIQTLGDPQRKLSDYALMEIYDQVTTAFMLKVIFNWGMKHMGKIILIGGVVAILIFTKVSIA